MPSSVIAKFDYDPQSKVLSIWFVETGHRYDYFDVPPETHQGLRDALSKGRYFSAHIRDGFSYRRVSTPRRRPVKVQAERITAQNPRSSS